MQLRDPRLGHPEHLPDLAEREVLVVVEGDDELLALGQAGDRLGELDCDVAQGYFLGRPTPAAGLDALLARSGRRLSVRLDPVRAAGR